MLLILDLAKHSSFYYTEKIMHITYDIFISYRRKGGAQYARIIQLMLAQRGYKVFLDLLLSAKP